MPQTPIRVKAVSLLRNGLAPSGIAGGICRNARTAEILPYNTAHLALFAGLLLRPFAE